MRLEFEAGPEDEGRKVYHVLKNRLRLSAEQIKRLKRADGAAVDGTPVHMDFRLSPGQRLTADLDAVESPPEFPAERGPLDVIYENEALLAVNKPAGLLTHPSRRKFTGTLANYAAGYLLDTSGSAVCHAVNRLDRDTSGVVLFAKNAHVKNLTVESLRSPEAEKAYLAVLCGELPEGRGTIDLPIVREREGFQKRTVREDGKRAVSEYETLAVTDLDGAPVSLARLRLRTGRTHQIRVHCAHLGAPVLGDRLYGNERSLALSEALDLRAHLLHALCLTFPDPLTGAALRLEAELTREDMRKIVKKFKIPY